MAINTILLDDPASLGVQNGLCDQPVEVSKATDTSGIWPFILNLVCKPVQKQCYIAHAFSAIIDRRLVCSGIWPRIR